ncbi:MAG: hypothetical protein LH606_08455 [Cytophagaceae bacterium]|nr:hypothetical protein [Cytophagaceae bacterium]
MSNPLAEVFGFPIANETERAKRYRNKRLFPFHNVVYQDPRRRPIGRVQCVPSGRAGYYLPSQISRRLADRQ